MMPISSPDRVIWDRWAMGSYEMHQRQSRRRVCVSGSLGDLGAMLRVAALNA